MFHPGITTAAGKTAVSISFWSKKVGLEICYAAAAAVMLAGGIGALIIGKYSSPAVKLGCAGVLAGTATAAVPAVAGLLSDPVNLFRLPVLILGAAGAIHSVGYLRGHGEEKAGVYFFFYSLTVAAMLGVTLAIKPLSFLVMWELMGIASFALVAFDNRSAETRRAAWIYLLACQAGGMILLALFLLNLSPLMIFILAVVGFGLKIGFPLLHVWLPQAHPAAPAPVSALMSGAMIQLGFYGILRWGIDPVFKGSSFIGYTFLILGAVCCLGGILFSLPRQNIKTLLAYSSIENMGIISLGLGMGFLGTSIGSVPVTFCGFAGAGLHLLNHALLKGGLFLIAGNVLKATGSLNMDTMGGLLKRMPVSGGLFLLNAAGLSGLPPFCAFVSEFLIYLAALSVFRTNANWLICSMGIIVPIILSLTGGLAAAAFCKTAGAVFLGESRSEQAAKASEVCFFMTFPILVLFLAGCCLMAVAPVLVMVIAPSEWAGELGNILHSLRMISRFSAGAAVIFSLLLLVKLFLLPRGKHARNACTWDCGFSAPDARMEYTGSAFVQPPVLFWQKLLGFKRHITAPEGDFPKAASYEEESGDPALDGFWKNIFKCIAFLAEKLHFIQSGYLHFYILLVTVTLIAMLVWAFLLPWSGTLFKGGAL